MTKKALENLNTAQQKAVTHSGGPLLITAGAGSGKTRTLTSRLVYLLENGVLPEHIIAVTFTNKAAKEMKSRIMNNELGIKDREQKTIIHNSSFILPFVGTFHSLGVHILKEHAEKVGRTKSFTIFDEDDMGSIVKKICADLDLPKEKFSPYAVMAYISNIKNELCNYTQLPAESRFESVCAKIFETYEETLQKSNAFDFDDLIEKVIRIFYAHPTILSRYQEMWKHVLVDEFQDVNTSQYELIKLLAEKHKNIFAIGDDAQSIYAFRGSDFRNFLNFEHDWPNTTIIKLEQNYRSSRNIVAAASELIKKNTLQKPKELWTDNPDGSLLHIAAFQNNEEEAWHIIETVATALKKGDVLSDIAVLYRTNAQSRAIEQALIHGYIPYEIYGGLKFYARKEIKDVLAGIRYAFNRTDQASIARLQKTFKKQQVAALLEDLPRLSQELTLVELISFFLENTHYTEYLATKFKNPDERLENIRELIQFAGTFTSPDDFLREISLMGAIDGRPKLEQNAVKLMTIHCAKGLEFKRVFIAGCNDGILPHQRSFATNDELEEERRLMYVAMTRAQKDLHINFYDLPSRFLGEIPPELVEFTKVTEYGASPSDWDDETIYIE
ncbi:MAG: UvrD-helicase domain-containing protein [bacterium]|nr:UvrD-helicase domain-containing protein [bacterium]